MVFNFLFVLLFTFGCEELDENGQYDLNNNGMSYTMPSEEALHEGTWLQWPHNNGWDRNHMERYEGIWLQMTKALHTEEKVHIIAYNDNHQTHIKALLIQEGVDMTKVDFLKAKTDDVWVRDNGPIFVYNENDELTITNWGFNGWGGDASYRHDAEIPSKISELTSIQNVNVNIINEGGSIELDGNGTLMAKRSSILNNNRNPGLTQIQAEEFFTTYLGVTNFIWLDGKSGLDITDDHIDGTARFANGNTIVCNQSDFLWEDEYDILSNAKNVNEEEYQIVELPVTPEVIPGAGYEGTYINFYVGNEVVLVPNFNLALDVSANLIIESLYPDKEVIGIDVTELYKDGGAIHCVTQQQPVERP